MTKKHFIAIADMLARYSCGYNTWRDLLEELADFFKKENRNFDKDRWISYLYQARKDYDERSNE